MNTDERVLEVLQKTLVKIEELNTRLGHIEEDLDTLDHLDQYVREIEMVTENNNIIG
ncbi:hypothetical protein ACSFB8_11925 [Enterococcus faecalis]